MLYPSLRIGLLVLPFLVPALAAKVIITASPDVYLPGETGNHKWEFGLKPDNTVDLRDLKLNPWWSTMVYKELPGGDQLGGGSRTFDKLIEHHPNCHFEGALVGVDDITFHFSPSSDFLYPCGDQGRGLRIECELDGKLADCTGKKPLGA